MVLVSVPVPVLVLPVTLLVTAAPGSALLPVPLRGVREYRLSAINSSLLKVKAGDSILLEIHRP